MLKKSKLLKSQGTLVFDKIFSNFCPSNHRMISFRHCNYNSETVLERNFNSHFLLSNSPLLSSSIPSNQFSSIHSHSQSSRTFHLNWNDKVILFAKNSLSQTRISCSSILNPSLSDGFHLKSIHRSYRTSTVHPSSFSSFFSNGFSSTKSNEPNENRIQARSKPNFENAEPNDPKPTNSPEITPEKASEKTPEKTPQKTPESIPGSTSASQTNGNDSVNVDQSEYLKENEPVTIITEPADEELEYTKIAEEVFKNDVRIIEKELKQEALDSYLSYAMSVIVGRALPDVRDGLKPVHRRILYSMHELGLNSKKPFKKCARVVGEVLGKYHPHGDSAVYDALVRLAQDFSLRFPLIDGHGNFGSVDSDPAAAMRYTECKLKPLSERMLLADMHLDTVDFRPNFDNSVLEPSVLPAKIPNLLINGSQGIAVGMATYIPPHNLGEVVDALCALINNPNASIQELMEYCPAPDFPTGGIIYASDGIFDAYSTGNGSITIKGKTHIEYMDKNSNRSRIVISEIPYQQNKATMVSRIADLANNKIIEGISDIRDESDRNGMRVVIELKKGVIPLIVLNLLFKHTSLQSRVNFNMVSLVNGEPKSLSLKDILHLFLEFRCDVIKRRANFLLNKAEEKSHLVGGIILALNNINEVVSKIRSAPNSAAALQSLQSIGLSEIQAEGVLSMPLRRLTSLENVKLEEELNQLLSEISNLNNLLSSHELVLKMVEKEALELKHEFPSPRKTVIEQRSDENSSDLEGIQNKQNIVMLSEKGYIKRLNNSAFSAQRRGGFGKSGSKFKSNDSIAKFVPCNTLDHLLLFSSKGTVYKVRGLHVPETSRTTLGSPISNVIPVEEGEKVTSMLSIPHFSDTSKCIIMLTKHGFIKRTPLSEFAKARKSGLLAIQLQKDDELKCVKIAEEDDYVIVGSKKSQVIKFLCKKHLRSMGRAARGVISMRMKNDDEVASLDVIPSIQISGYSSEAEKGDEVEEEGEISDEEHEAKGEGEGGGEAGEEGEKKESKGGPWLLFVTEKGYGKRVEMKAFPSLSRGCKGLMSFKLTPEDSLAAVFFVDQSESDENELLLGSQGGQVTRMRINEISIQGRKTKGVKLMRLEDDRVIASSILPSSDLEKDEEEVEETEIEKEVTLVESSN